MQNQYYWDLEDPVMDSIAHHGILGQKWGIRRLIKQGHDTKYWEKASMDEKIKVGNSRTEAYKKSLPGRTTKLDEASSKLNDFTNKDLFKWRKKNV